MTETPERPDQPDALPDQPVTDPSGDDAAAADQPDTETETETADDAADA